MDARGALVVAAVLLLTGCSSAQPEPQPEPTAATSAPAPAEGAAP
jgi:PBP1b-binding outer membrane lipoprotein LpoB